MNFEKLCRTCAKEENNLIFLFQDKNIPKILMEIATVNITENDGFPSNICAKCVDQMHAAILFKKQCEEVHKKFVTYSQVKAEIKSEQVVDVLSGTNPLEFSGEKNITASLPDKSENSSEDSHSLEPDNDIDFWLETEENKVDSAKKKKRKCVSCPICNKVLSRSTFLKDHMLSHTKEKPFECKVCGLRLRYKCNVKRHMKTHSENSQSENEKKLFLCNTCGKSFSYKHYLEQHLRVHTGERPFKCTFCEKCFRTVATLYGHIRTHTGERPYACDLCSKSFTQKPHLKYHLAMHKGEKRYHCTYCDKRFASNQTLQLHLRTHTGEKPFVCAVCDRSFYDSRTLKKHKH